MNEFGILLRRFRKDCKDPRNPDQILTQMNLGQLLGEEMNMLKGYSGAAISDWENGKSKIHADQRHVLVSLIRVLHRLGGIKKLSEAEELLSAGNYRGLDSVEREKIFRDSLNESKNKMPVNKVKERHEILLFVGRILFKGSDNELESYLQNSEEGPSPSWPRLLIGLLQRSANRLTVSQLLYPLLWLWVGLICWAIIMPSLRWPFMDQRVAINAICAYVGGTIAIPLLIGLFTETSHDNFWLDKKLSSSLMTRLYTYQGASIGFHLGYFLTFAISLLGYYAHLQGNSTLEFLAVVVILLLGYAGARVVPYNLWRAYGRLYFKDGWPFFVYFLLGPLWGLFFLTYSSLLLDSVLGGLSILFSISLVVLIAGWRFHRLGSTRK